MNNEVWSRRGKKKGPKRKKKQDMRGKKKERETEGERDRMEERDKIKNGEKRGKQMQNMNKGGTKNIIQVSTQEMQEFGQRMAALCIYTLSQQIIVPNVVTQYQGKDTLYQKIKRRI